MLLVEAHKADGIFTEARREMGHAHAR
jgi:hypothetical protein